MNKVKRIITGTALSLILGATFLGSLAQAKTNFHQMGDSVDMATLGNLIESGNHCSVVFGRKDLLRGSEYQITAVHHQNSYYEYVGRHNKKIQEFTGEIMKRIHIELGGGQWLYVHPKDVISCK